MFGNGNRIQFAPHGQPYTFSSSIKHWTTPIRYATTKRQKRKNNLWFGHPPDLSTRRVWGCKVQARDVGAGHAVPHSKEGVYLGQAFRGTGWRVLNMDTGRVFVTRNAVFFERQFPLSTKIREQDPAWAKYADQRNVGVPSTWPAPNAGDTIAQAQGEHPNRGSADIGSHAMPELEADADDIEPEAPNAEAVVNEPVAPAENAAAADGERQQEVVEEVNQNGHH